MIGTCIYISLVVFMMIMMVESTIYQQKLYKTIANPNITSTFLSSADFEIIGCKDQNKCSLHCVKDEKCQAAVYDSYTEICSLLYKGVYVTTVSQPNGLVYLQNVCSQQTTDRPSSCPKVWKVYKDCQEAFEYGERTSGVYELAIQDFGSIKVWCNFDDDHGWTVVQRRQDGSVDFFLNWDDYKNGFGDVEGEYWLGNDYLHELTKTNQKLHFYLEAADGTFGNANYSQFYINDESDFYKMTLSTVDYSGDVNVVERFSYHNEMMFTTKDKDHDIHTTIQCADNSKGAWWYTSCTYVNINGVYSSNGVSGGWAGFQPLLKVTMELSRD